MEESRSGLFAVKRPTLCVYDKPQPEDMWYLNQMITNTSHCYTHDDGVGPLIYGKSCVSTTRRRTMLFHLFPHTKPMNLGTYDSRSEPTSR